MYLLSYSVVIAIFYTPTLIILHCMQTFLYCNGIFLKHYILLLQVYVFFFLILLYLSTSAISFYYYCIFLHAVIFYFHCIMHLPLQSHSIMNCLQSTYMPRLYNPTAFIFYCNDDNNVPILSSFYIMSICNSLIYFYHECSDSSVNNLLFRYSNLRCTPCRFSTSSANTIYCSSTFLPLPSTSSVNIYLTTYVYHLYCLLFSLYWFTINICCILVSFAAIPC